jgi:hypothetical protein
MSGRGGEYSCERDWVVAGSGAEMPGIGGSASVSSHRLVALRGRDLVVIPDGGGGGSFEGINPQLLAQLIRALSSGASDGQQVAGSYVWQFQRLGLDTGALTRLQQDYNWASSQNPMLARRHDLASNQPSGQWEDGFATSGAGYLQWTTAGQAQGGGHSRDCATAVNAMLADVAAALRSEPAEVTSQVAQMKAKMMMLMSRDY